MRRLSLLLLLALAGCGSSGNDTIDAHNAKKLELSKPSDTPMASAVATSGSALELVSPSGKWKVSAGRGTVRFVDAETGRTLDTLVSRIHTPTAIAWTRDSRTFAVGGYHGGLTVWQEFDHKTYDLSVPASAVHAIGFSPDASLLVTGQADGGIRIWSLSSRKEVARLAPHIAADAVRFSADGRRISAGNVERSWQLTLPR